MHRIALFKLLCGISCVLTLAGCHGHNAQAHGDDVAENSLALAGPWQIQGRVSHDSDGSWRLAWAGSAVRARFTGASVGFDLANGAEGQQTTYGVTIDDQNAKIVELSARHTHYTFDNLSAGAHTVTVRKINEAGFGEGKFYGFTLEPHEQFLPMAGSLGRRVEFIGDGRVNGFAVESDDAGCHQGATNENVEMAYGALAAHALHADYRVIAASNRGVARNRDGSTSATVRDLWERDVTPQWQPQVVVVDAGAADFSGSHESEAVFVSAYADLLRRVRHAYPQAYVVCAVPNVASDSHGQAAAWVQDAVHTVGDARVRTLDFASSPASSDCGGLPSAAAQVQMATRLTAFVSTLTGW